MRSLLGASAALLALGRPAAALKNDPNSIAGLNWVELEGGWFTRGAETGSALAYSGQNNINFPAYEAWLDPFSISDAEVTNAQYIDFLNEAIADGDVYVGYEDRDWVLQPGQEVRVGYGEYADNSMILLDGESIEEPPINHCYVGYNESIADDQNPFYLKNATMADWPVIFVRFYGALAFAEHYNVSLPTGAMHEYAARANRTDFVHPSSTGEATMELINFRDWDHIANWTGQVVDVRSYPPNAFGLYDMAGNAWEWCRDWMNLDGYGCDPAVNPMGPDLEEPPQDGTATGGPSSDYSDSSRIVRGGSYNYHMATTETTFLRGEYPFRGNDHFGFRVASYYEYRPNAVCDSGDGGGDDSSDEELTDSQVRTLIVVGSAAALIIGALVAYRRFYDQDELLISKNRNNRPQLSEVTPALEMADRA